MIWKSIKKVRAPFNSAHRFPAGVTYPAGRLVRKGKVVQAQYDDGTRETWMRHSSEEQAQEQYVSLLESFLENAETFSLGRRLIG